MMYEPVYFNMYTYIGFVTVNATRDQMTDYDYNAYHVELEYLPQVGPM